MDKDSENYYKTQAAIFGNRMQNTFSSLTPGLDLTLDTLEAAVEELQKEPPVHLGNSLLPKMEVVESRYLPDGVSVLRNDTQMAICNHTTGRVVMVDIPDPFRHVMEVTDEDIPIRFPPAFLPNVRFPFIEQTFRAIGTISLDDFHADAYGILRPQQYKDAARCRQRHYRARRQGGTGR